MEKFIRLVLCGLISLICMWSICYAESAEYNLNNILANSSTDQGQTVTVKPGERIFYEASVHGSVGSSCKYVIEDSTVVKFVEEKTAYLYSERSNMPGGDAAKETFYFEAVQPGNTRVTLQHMYRGNIETEKVINVIVVDQQITQ